MWSKYFDVNTDAVTANTSANARGSAIALPVFSYRQAKNSMLHISKNGFYSVVKSKLIQFIQM